MSGKTNSASRITSLPSISQGVEFPPIMEGPKFPAGFEQALPDEIFVHCGEQLTVAQYPLFERALVLYKPGDRFAPGQMLSLQGPGPLGSVVVRRVQQGLFPVGYSCSWCSKGITKKKAMESNLLNIDDIENLRLVEELAKTCYEMDSVTSSGLAPEIAYFHIELY